MVKPEILGQNPCSNKLIWAPCFDMSIEELCNVEKESDLFNEVMMEKGLMTPVSSLEGSNKIFKIE